MLTRPVNDEEIIRTLGETWETLFSLLRSKTAGAYERDIRLAMDKINDLNINIRIRGIEKGGNYE